MADDPKYRWLHGEPSVDEMMAERITRLVMERDRLNPADVRDALEAAAAALQEADTGNQTSSSQAEPVGKVKSDLDPFV